MPPLHLRRFLDAMSFFTCLVPARLVSGTTLADCVPWIIPCGLVVGSLCTLAAACAGLLLAGSPAGPAAALLAGLVAGLAWLVCEMLVSRGLHWDGLADMADALGSYREGPAFRAVLKDSRLGTFGALALLVVFLAQLLGAAGHVLQGSWAVLVLAPAWGRGMAVLLFCLGTPYDSTSLGGRFAQTGRRMLPATLAAGLGLLVILALAGCHPGRLVLLALGQALLTRRILAWSRRHGGYSGDFAGCFMELGQTLCLVLTL